MIEIKNFKSREEWLKARKSFIGGSDAACIMGESPWKTNLDLYREKIGTKEPVDLSNNELVQYGAEAEQYHRELFKLDYPDMKVEYSEHNMWLNTSYPWAHASLDGWMYDKDGRLGVFECKTAMPQNAAQRKKWESDRFPDYYYWQILHYFLVTDAEFAILRAQVKLPDKEYVCAWVKHYRIERSAEEYNMYRLLCAERDFAEHIRNKTEPALKLPYLN